VYGENLVVHEERVTFSLVSFILGRVSSMELKKKKN